MKSLLVCLATLLVATIAQGDTLQGVGGMTALMDIDGSYGTFGKKSVGGGEMAVLMEVTPGSIDYHSVTINANDMDVRLSKTFTDFGRSAQITTVLDFDTIEVTAENVGPLALARAVGGIYDVQDYRHQDPVFPLSIVVAGTYTITGPTEEAVGRFALPFTQNDQNAQFPDYQLNAGGFPNYVDLLSTYYARVGYDQGRYGIDFGAVVDGFPVGIDLQGVWFASHDVPAEFVHAPEPSTCVMLAMVGLMGVCISVRKMKKKE